ncbi:ArgJ-domain-containing protein [Macroventuria anomochaeta]|uniref:ArgJ-domain-containing protein n=1 Tax=Macroventuria anomochaeta TaxID=301207 RepID=A0ACB6RSY1_9PLEO|nr:ArgJ-domain-containing protein [Macroventuria anomochaeta]KAF2624039.1 ArgJ-domain-containing protein [Macroventuria anomochaeta]
MSLARPNPRFLARTNRIFASQTRSYAAPGDGAIPAAKKKYIPTSGTYPLGFKAGSAHVGVKASNTRLDDLALIASDSPCTGAAVFTTNKFQAAPVTVSRNLLKSRKGEGIRSVIINSGCANAVTGKGGIEDATLMGKETDKAFTQDSNGEDDGQSRSLVMSTGVIGQRLPIQKIVSKIPTAYYNLGDTHEHWLGTAKAICTTDTFPKLLSKSFTLPSSHEEYHIAGMTKGAGMIHPNMATLLGVICTDAPVAAGPLQTALSSAITKSFNSISIDGDTSTNDTVAILANGAAGGRPISSTSSPDFDAFQKTLTDFAIDLAKLVVRDGEGATKFVTIRVTNAATYEDAHRVASTIARSPLVKTALYGKDANWGRILCATGYAENVDGVIPEETSVSFIPSDGSEELKLLVSGEPEQVDEERAAKILEAEDLEIKVQLSEGKYREEAVFWTCDFSHDVAYVASSCAFDVASSRNLPKPPSTQLDSDSREPRALNMANLTFPYLRDDWSLDVVNILAFLGEHNILACSQQICMSPLCFLPRLIPAPQGLLAQRPKKLESEDDVRVMGIHSGNERDSLSYYARMIHSDGSELPSFTTRIIDIGFDDNISKKGLKRPPPIRPRLFSPMNLIAIFSCAISFGLAAWAVVLGDAVALTGILVMSFTTPLLCVGMRWTTSLPRFHYHDSAPPSTVVIRYPNGSFTIVRCNESIARMLYFHPEYIDYTVSSFTGRGLSGTVGGLTLVGSIVLFGNAVWTIKAALAVTYTVLNLLYWIAAILPTRLSWHVDFDITPPEIIPNPTFTRSLWTAIWVTKTSDWVKDGVPRTAVWNEWLKQAQMAARTCAKHDEWDAQGVLIDLLTKET